jgi:hypothetical protein
MGVLSHQGCAEYLAARWSGVKGILKRENNCRDMDVGPGKSADELKSSLTAQFQQKVTCTPA